jgi:hypothetical protein
MAGIQERKKKFTYVPKKKDKGPSLADCIEHADDLAQQVVNKWGASGGDAAPLSTEFRVLFEKACRYRSAKERVECHRGFNVVTEGKRKQLAAEEAATRKAFAKSYKDFCEKDAHAGE